MKRLLAQAMLAAALLTAASAHAQAQVQVSAPANWSRTQDGDTVIYTPAAEPAGTAQLLLLAPKPASGDFYQQFEAERAQLEQYWGLRAPAPVDPQSGQSAEGPWAAHFASYDSDGGARYMSFLARALRGQFVLLVFVAATHEAFNRVAPQATELFKTVRVATP
ncbi:MAG: hypothetical protein AB1761_18410 [Pseudomonadota bacterium]